MTIVMVVIVVGFILVLKLIGGDSGSHVGVTPSAAGLAGPVTAVGRSVGVTVTTSTVDEAAGRQQVLDGDLDALVTGSPTAFQVVVKKDVPKDLGPVFSALARQLALNDQIVRLGGDPAAVTSALSTATFDVQSLEPVNDYQVERLVLGIIVAILVYIGMVLYGQLVAQGVVEEKSSRIVELLLTTIRPWQLMIGKVGGIGLVGLSQMLVIVLAGVGTGLATGVIDFPASIAAGAAAWAVVWFLLGYIAYALMFAAVGALVSRQEDVGAATAPVLMLLVIPYVLGISILPSNPDNPILGAASVVPLFAPTLMPIRMAMGVAPTWQVILSVVLTVAMIVGLVWLAGRVYSNAVLRMGSRVRLVDALRSAG